MRRKELPRSPYVKVVDELSYSKGVLVRGTKVMIPVSYRPGQ